MEKDKLYVVLKYIKAVSVLEAIRKERKTPVHEVYVDGKWQEEFLPTAIGFKVADNG